MRISSGVVVRMNGCARAFQPLMNARMLATRVVSMIPRSVANLATVADFKGYS